MRTLVKKHRGKIALGVFTILLAPFLISYATNLISNHYQISQNSKIEVANKLIVDLEKIRTLVPSNVELEECLKSRSGSFDEKYELCFKKIKQDGNEARSLLKRNLSSIQVFYEDDFYRQVEEYINSIDYGLYEMGENQLVQESWTQNGCSDGIDIISNTEANRNKLKKNDTGSIICTLSVQDSSHFLNDIASSSPCGLENDCVSAMKERRIDFGSVESLIVEGSSTSMHKYFAKQNSALYSVVDAEIEKLLILIKHQIGA